MTKWHNYVSLQSFLLKHDKWHHFSSVSFKSWQKKATFKSNTWCLQHVEMGLCHVLSAVLYPRWKTSAFTCALKSDYTSRSIGVNKLCKCTDFLATRQFAVVGLWVESSHLTRWGIYTVLLWRSWATSVNVYVIPQHSIRKLASEVAARAKSTAAYASVNSSRCRNNPIKNNSAERFCIQVGEMQRMRKSIWPVRPHALVNRVKAKLSGVLFRLHSNSSGPIVVELRHRHALLCMDVNALNLTDWLKENLRQIWQKCFKRVCLQNYWFVPF